MVVHNERCLLSYPGSWERNVFDTVPPLDARDLDFDILKRWPRRKIKDPDGTIESGKRVRVWRKMEERCHR